MIPQQAVDGNELSRKTRVFCVCEIQLGVDEAKQDVSVNTLHHLIVIIHIGFLDFEDHAADLVEESAIENTRVDPQQMKQ